MSHLTSKPVLALLVVVVVLVVGVGLFIAGRSSASGDDGSVQQETSATDGAGSDSSTDVSASDEAQDPAEATAATIEGDPSEAVTVATVRPRPEIPVTVSTSRTTDLGSGEVIDVRLDADPGSQIYGVEARVCAGDASVELPADFAPTQIGLCALHPLAPGATDYINLPVSPPYASAAFSYTVGTGTDQFAIAETLGGKPVSITCDRNHPCQLVLKLQVPEDVRFHSIPLTFA